MSDYHLLQYVANYPPEIGTCHLEYELDVELVQKTSKVTVVTMLPRRLLTPNSHKYSTHKAFLTSIEKKLRVIRLFPQLSGSTSLIGKTFDYFICGISAILGIFLVRSPDAILVSSPPLTIALIACIHGKIINVPVIVRIGDIVPDALVDLGFNKHSSIIKLLQLMEKMVYRYATQITVIAPEYSIFLNSKGVPKDKISIIYNWAEPSLLSVEKKQRSQLFNNIIDDFNKKIVIYAGSLSYSQDIDTILSAAKKLLKESIFFIIMGNGPLFNHLMKRKINENITNLVIIPAKPRQSYLEFIKSSDIAIVSLGSWTKTPTLPSKTIELMALGLPIIALCNADSALAAFLRKTESGMTVSPGDSQTLADVILLLKENETMTQKIGNNGKHFTTNYVSLKHVSAYYHEIIRNTLR
jgi:colanic acid biosynthesis glycosyl transferase WcaI